MAGGRPVLPPGFKVVDRHAPSRSYRVYAAPSGKIFQSRLGAWRYYDTSGVASSAPVVEPSALHDLPSPASYRISLGPSTELVMLAASVGLAPSELPKGVLDCIQASRSPFVPQELRLLATEQVLLFGRERISSAGPPLPTPFPVAPASSSAQALKEIGLLRQELPPGCERRMFGSEHGYNQLPSVMRNPILQRKYLSIAGRNGQAIARDRRALSRYKGFCSRSNITPPFPVGAGALSAFIEDAFRSSKGKKGGRSVAHSLKLSFVHLSHHCGLPVELDAPIFFNTVKPYNGDSDTATSPSLWAVQQWEVLALHSPDPAVRLAFRVALLASLLSTRAVHMVGATALSSSTALLIAINLASDKDGSVNIWAGCDAVGISGPLEWWPSFLHSALEAGFLVPNVRAPSEVTSSSTNILQQSVTSDGMVILTKLAFLSVDVSLPDQVAFHFTGHSFRHFLPCIAELLAWLSSIRDELGRWATGAANSKRKKCGPRYTVMANRALQLFIRRVAVQACTFLLNLSDEGSGSAVPCFDFLASCVAVWNSLFFGQGAISYVPGFGRPV